MAHPTREADRIARVVEKAGLRVKRTKNGYVAYGADGVTTVGWHRSPSDHRAMRNLKQDLRQIGVEI